MKAGMGCKKDFFFRIEQEGNAYCCLRIPSKQQVKAHLHQPIYPFVSFSRGSYFYFITLILHPTPPSRVGRMRIICVCAEDIIEKELGKNR